MDWPLGWLPNLNRRFKRSIWRRLIKDNWLNASRRISLLFLVAGVLAVNQLSLSRLWTQSWLSVFIDASIFDRQPRLRVHCPCLMIGNEEASVFLLTGLYVLASSPINNKDSSRRVEHLKNPSYDPAQTYLKECRFIHWSLIPFILGHSRIKGYEESPSYVPQYEEELMTIGLRLIKNSSFKRIGSLVFSIPHKWAANRSASRAANSSHKRRPVRVFAFNGRS